MELFLHQNIVEDSIELTEAEVRHLRVLRKKVGDLITITDGNGMVLECVIEIIDTKKCIVRALKTNIVDVPTPKLTLAISPLKNPDRFEWLVEKCTECGVSTIAPIICERTESNLKKTDRIHRLMQSATIQSLQYHLPELLQPISVIDFVSIQNAEQKFIAWCEKTPKEPIINALKDGKSTIILIGPEGDFTKAEFSAAMQNGYKAISLGNNRLRSETAAIIATQTFYLKNSNQ